MSALGQKRTCAAQEAMSALGQKRTLLSWSQTTALGLRHLSCRRTPRRLPKLRGHRLPIKRVIAWTVPLQVIDARDRVFDTRSMSDGHPPHHEIRTIKVLEPFGTATVEALVDRLIDEPLESLDALPDRQIDRDATIGIRPRIRRVSAFINVPPHESGCPLGQTVHNRQIAGEIRHARVFDFVADASDVQLRKMMIGWLLQGSVLRCRGNAQNYLSTNGHAMSDIGSKADLCNAPVHIR
jgi:hypothetical protein